MPSSRSRFLAYARLLRLPNVFTAVADPLAGWFVVGGGEPWWQLPLLVGASACFYTSGIVFNDCFDYKLDKLERPERPLPSGQIPRSTAWVLAVGLMAAGLVLALCVGRATFGVGAFLAALILFYDVWARRFATLRPWVLGGCRFANFLLGMRCTPPRLWWFPAILGAYVAVVTFLSLHEAGNPKIQANIGRLLLGIIVLDATLVAIAPMGGWIGAALVLALLIPAMALSKVFAMS
jgi:4-hydroxybenzoate polyprenyltransferase